MSEQFHIPIAKHLEDVDDLFQGRDAELVEGQEGRAQIMADEVYRHAIENNFEILLFCVLHLEKFWQRQIFLRRHRQILP